MDWIHTNIAFSAVPRSNNETVFSPIPFRDPMMPHRAKRMFNIWEVVRKSTAGIWTGLRRTSANIISPSSHPKLLTIQSRTMHLRQTEMDEMLKETIATEKIARLWSLRGSMFRWIKPGSQVVIFDLMRLSAHAFEREGPSFQLLHIPETVKTPISTVIEYQWTVKGVTEGRESRDSSFSGCSYVQWILDLPLVNSKQRWWKPPRVSTDTFSGGKPYEVIRCHAPILRGRDNFAT